MTKFRSLVAIASALAGVGFGVMVTSACSGGCDCPPPKDMVTGEFTVTTTTLNDGAPEALRNLDVKGLTITDETAVVHYTRAGEGGTATFTFGNRY